MTETLTDLPADDDIEIPVGDFTAITVTRGEFDRMRNGIWRDARITFGNKLAAYKAEHAASVAELARTVIALAKRFDEAPSGCADSPPNREGTDS